MSYPLYKGPGNAFQQPGAELGPSGVTPVIPAGPGPLRLPKSQPGQILTSKGGQPVWATPEPEPALDAERWQWMEGRKMLVGREVSSPLDAPASALLVGTLVRVEKVLGGGLAVVHTVEGAAPWTVFLSDLRPTPEGL